MHLYIVWPWDLWRDPIGNPVHVASLGRRTVYIYYLGLYIYSGSHLKHFLRLCLDAYVSTSIHICWSEIECNLVQLHSNPLEHMWIAMNTYASKQGLRVFSDTPNILQESCVF